jgi:hypothetical protein
MAFPAHINSTPPEIKLLARMARRMTLEAFLIHYRAAGTFLEHLSHQHYPLECALVARQTEFFGIYREILFAGGMRGMADRTGVLPFTGMDILFAELQ